MSRGDEARGEPANGEKERESSITSPESGRARASTTCVRFECSLRYAHVTRLTARAAGRRRDVTPKRPAGCPSSMPNHARRRMATGKQHPMPAAPIQVRVEKVNERRPPSPERPKRSERLNEPSGGNERPLDDVEIHAPSSSNEQVRGQVATFLY